MMKVLWFTNTASLGANQLGIRSNGGGWIQSLEAIIGPEIQLSICFYHKKKHSPFTIGTTTYYPIKAKHETTFGKIFKRLFRRIENEKDVDQFLKVVNTVNPDVIHIHGTEGPFGLIQSKTNIPTLVSIQGIVTVCRLKYFSGIPKNVILRFTPIIDRVLRKGKIDHFSYFYKTALREQIILKYTKNISGRTNWDKRVSAVLSPDSNYFHLDEILREGFYSSVWNPNTNKQASLFSTLGSDLYKGLEIVLLCAQLLDQLDISYCWKIAGVSRNDKILRIISKSIKTPISPNIYFLGSLTETRLIQELTTANLYIGTSHIENSPNSICEAMIIGIPVISSYAGGIPSLIDNDIDGVLIQDGDPYCLGGAIVELLNNPEKARELGRNARKRALNRHDKDVIKTTLIKIYKTISNNSAKH